MKEFGNVVLLEPGKPGRIGEIDLSLESMQKIVGGMIQVIYPFWDSACLVCNDDGKNFGLPLNRALCDESDEVYDIVAGTFFICRQVEGELVGLTEDQAEHYLKKYRNPEKFGSLEDGTIVVVEYMNGGNGDE